MPRRRFRSLVGTPVASRGVPPADDERDEEALGQSERDRDQKILGSEGDADDEAGQGEKQGEQPAQAVDFSSLARRGVSLGFAACASYGAARHLLEDDPVDGEDPMTSETQARPNPPSLTIIVLFLAIIAVGALMIASVVSGVLGSGQSDAFKRIEQKLDAGADGAGR